MTPMFGAFTSARDSAYKPLRAEHPVSKIGLSQRLELRQSQALVMTPQLQQTIKLLQLSNLELAEYVEQELEKDPLLERDEREPTENREPQDEQAPQNHDEPLEATLAREDFNKADE